MFLVSNYPHLPISPTNPGTDRANTRATKRPAIRRAIPSEQTRAEDALNTEHEHPDWLTLSDEERVHEKLSHSHKQQVKQPSRQTLLSNKNRPQFEVGQQIKVMNLLALSQPVVLHNSIIKETATLPCCTDTEQPLTITQVVQEPSKDKPAPANILQQRFKNATTAHADQEFEVTC